jgi:signal transduction histidine kinase/ActR/RegA family two-component response regulator
MIKIFGFLLLICSAGIVLGTDREFGHPIFRTFNAHDYGQVGQIFTITEDPHGPMLFGCEDAILVFDDSRWETIPTPGTGFIRSFGIDGHGVVWFTSSTQIGYLSRVDGKYQVVKVYDGSLGFDSRVVVNGSRLYFATETGLLNWENGHISKQPWPTDSITPYSSAVFDGRIWAADRTGSIYEFDGRSFQKIADSPSSEAGDVRAMMECPGGDRLIVRSSGIYRKSGATFARWSTDIDPLLKSAPILGAKWILSRYLAVLLKNSGVYLLNQEGRLIVSFTVNSGLGEGETLGEDQEGGLWVGADTQITRIECAIECTEFDRELGLPKGWVTGVTRFQGEIYAATQHGVYVLKAAGDASESPHFVRFGDRTDRFFGIAIGGSTAFAVSDIGAYSLDVANSRFAPIGPRAAVITPSRIDPQRVFLSTQKRLESVRNSDGRWSSEDVLSELPYFIGGVAEDENGDLFLCSESNGFYWVHLDRGAQPIFRNARVERLLDVQDQAVPSGQGSVCQWQGQMLFVGAGRVWQLAQGKNRMEPFGLTAQSLPGRDIQMIVRSHLRDEYVWISSRPPGANPETGFEIGRLYSSGRYEPLPHTVSYPLGIINNIWDENVEGEPAVWVAGDYGLMRVFLDRPVRTRRKFELYPDQISTADGKFVPVGTGKELKLRYDDRDFQIRFGTDHFSVGDELSYQATLEGGMGMVDRSPIMTTPIWRSGALSEGHYVLRVNAKDSDGMESKMFTFAFTIKSPWYRTLWMETAWASLAILIVYLFIRWRTWQMTLRERELVQTVELRTRELSEREIELRKAKEHAESASRAKTAFLANVSHELRTPINSILGYTQILQRRPEIREPVKSRLATIMASGEHLLEMINEILDLSRVESGNVSVTLRPLELPKFITGIVDEFEVRAVRGNLRFIHETTGALPEWIQTDPVRLRQVLYNLLGNAMKFTTQGEVSFRVFAELDRIRFEVADTGKGIPQPELPFIFQPFYQATNNDLSTQGAGLGLYISKQIVDLLGGQIMATSGLGQGSTFSFVVPLQEALPDLHVRSPLITGYQGSRRKILVVDDEPLNRSMLRELLSTVGFDSAEAESPEQALTQISNGFDAVISDIRMPGSDGHTFCRNLRSSAETKDLIIIASSASVFADDQRLALASGFNDFLPKPVMEDELFEILGKHLGLKWIYN